jgi:SAM-dependent methyltransferase
VTTSGRDRWAQWLLERRFGGDEAACESTLRNVARFRDRILDQAQLGEGETLLDVGAGDGLVGFGALERLGPDGVVIFSDISADLLEHCRELAAELGAVDRCRFVRASADALAPIGGASVDVVTTRSVLIYVDREAKRRAFEEFHRVLRPSGRLSIFEPINSFGSPHPPGWFFGYDLTAVAELVAKLQPIASPAAEATLIDFDERDLVAWADAAGFDPIRLEYEAELKPGSWLSGDWETVLRTSPNPLAPTLGEALERAFTPEERAVFEQHLRPLVEADAGRSRMAGAYLTATKP